MPWALSPNHYFAPKNQNVVKLWKTSSDTLCRHVAFSVTERITMHASSLSSLLHLWRQSGLPLDLTLRGGKHLQVTVRSVGDTWFSAQETGAYESELVVSRRAVCLMRGGSLEEEQQTSKSSGVPLSAMLLQLERQATQTIVHLSDVVLVGNIIEVGIDWFGLKQKDGSQVIVPLHEFLWLQTCA